MTKPDVSQALKLMHNLLEHDAYPSEEEQMILDAASNALLEEEDLSKKMKT